MSGVAADEVAVICSGMGYLPWQADTGEVVFVKCYYSPDAADTKLSPTDIVVNNIHNYEAWEQYSHIDTGKGYIKFHRRGGNPDITFNLSSNNGLWFHGHATSDY